MRRLWGDETMDKYKSDLRLIEHVVNEFDKHANWLEASIQRLRIGATNLMSDHGRNLLQQHGDIQRLAETGTLHKCRHLYFERERERENYQVDFMHVCFAISQPHTFMHHLRHWCAPTDRGY